MKHNHPVASDRGRVPRGGAPSVHRVSRRGFSLVEILVVVTLLSLIVLVLMAVFNSTQRAFRAAVTQTDVLEGGRATVGLIAADLRGLTPSGGVSNGPANFFVLANPAPYAPLYQNLPGGASQPRTNLLNLFFVLSRENTKWTGVGYIVDSTSADPLYPLYRFYAETNIAFSPRLLYDEFVYLVNNGQWTNMSHVMDGVVHLTLRAYDPNGTWINGFYTNALKNTQFLSPVSYGEAQLYMFGTTVPASVELELGVLEDSALARAGSLPFQTTAQVEYLKQQAGRVHLFRQRVAIPNVDPAAYQ